MGRTFIRDFADGDDVEEVLLVQEKQVRSNRNAKLYLQLELADRTGTLDGRYWNVSEPEAREVEQGDFLAVKGKVQVFQGHLQLIIHQYRKCDPSQVELDHFIPSSGRDPSQVADELRAELAKVRDPYLQAIAQAFLMDEDLMRAYRQVPAGVRHHHAYLGGLIEHVVQLLKVVDRLAPLYPRLDADLLRMGVFLHDLGKVRELRVDRGFYYTDEGQLIGHLVIGVELLDSKLRVASELLGEPIPKPTVLRLKHLILSHHGQYVFGSPKLPMFPEAIALHTLDSLDSKLAHMFLMLDEDAYSEAAWTPFDATIGVRIYKGTEPSP